ncbi:MAG: hypothetical protein IT365_08340 [Candidatus Hydrogenedentes bacterium]|nr:hypothetical protein [Candidatus Hydrogenedentota bacterium]
MLNEDYKDILRELSAEGAKFLLLGAYAMAVHGYLRATMDLDLWVDPSPRNAVPVFRALRRFGAPLGDLTEEDLSQSDTVFQIGVAPRRIDIMTGASGLQFEEAHERSLRTEIEGIEVHVLSLGDLIQNKKAVGRTRDLADVEALELLRKSRKDA